MRRSEHDTERHGDRLSIALVVRGNPTRPTGATERFFETHRALQQHGDVALYVLTSDEPVAPDERVDTDVFTWIPMCSRGLRPLDYLVSLTGRLPRRLAAADLRRQRRVVERFLSSSHDLVWAYGDRAFLSLPSGLRRNTPIVVDLIDFEVPRDLELTRQATRQLALRSVLARVDARSSRNTLRRIIGSADRAVISSERDRRLLGDPRVQVLPNTYRLRGAPAGRAGHTGPPIFLFVGFLRYQPNIDAVDWLIRDIWPDVLDQCPEAQLRIVGRGLASDAYPDRRGVTIVGELDSMDSELAKATASLAPLRFGSGTRIKILESWAHQVPVGSTTIGAEGLTHEHGVNVMIADTPSDFAAAMVRLAAESELRGVLTANGRRSWTEYHHPSVAERHVSAIVSEILS
jgi:glycosyltransferase involved in cell wall biosynthesis